MENGQNRTNQNPQNSQNQAKSSSSPQAGAQSSPSSNMQGNSGSSQQGSGMSGMSDMLNKSGLNNITSKLQQFGSSTAGKVGNLSTTQKVVGGSLLALGAGWLAVNSMNKQKANRSSGGTYVKNSSTAGKNKR